VYKLLPNIISQLS